MNRVRSLATAAIITGTLLGGGISTATSAAAAAQSIDYIAGKDTYAGSCKGWLNRDSSNGYVQALGQSWNNNQCVVYLERMRLGSGGYGWTPVSSSYFLLNSTAATGFHWNGTDAASHVCIDNATTGQKHICGDAAW
ncbi:MULTISPECIES: hypothetical protein [Streptomyces]|uniref:Uncharacterized protein n=2 Tax=Streptomyces TaxID=1883 RepID=A0ABV9J0V0_9ACTN